jgi:hypothetical protein
LVFIIFSATTRDLILALVVGRVLEPSSKLAAARALSPQTASSSLGEMLGLGEVDEDELYAALDWLLERQPAVEIALAKRYLRNGTLILYDVASSYMEGRCCSLAKLGKRRDHKKGTLQIIYGLLCAPDGCPVAIEVFDSNTGDPMTVAKQVEKSKQRFHLDHVACVGDRGMITQARITRDIQAAGLDWITSLRAPAIRTLVNSGIAKIRIVSQHDAVGASKPHHFVTQLLRLVADHDGNFRHAEFLENGNMTRQQGRATELQQGLCRETLAEPTAPASGQDNSATRREASDFHSEPPFEAPSREEK